MNFHIFIHLFIHLFIHVFIADCIDHQLPMREVMGSIHGSIQINTGSARIGKGLGWLWFTQCQDNNMTEILGEGASERVCILVRQHYQVAISANVLSQHNVPDGITEWEERPTPFWGIWGFGPRGFEPWSSQTNDSKIYTCHFQARYSALLGYGKDQLIQMSG